MAAQLQEEVQLLEKRMAKLERLVQNLYDKLEVALPEGGDPAAGEPSEQVMELLRGGNKIQAVKLHRQQTGLRLAEAQAAVERYE